MTMVALMDAQVDIDLQLIYLDHGSKMHYNVGEKIQKMKVDMFLYMNLP